VSKSVLEHDYSILRIMQRQVFDLTYPQALEIAADQLKTLEFEGINPYKFYKLFKHYRPYVPVKYHSDKMYAEASPEVLAKVMAKKVDRRVFRAALKKKTKYERAKEQLENVVFGNDDEAVT
jgi:hypothetical protein